MKKRLYGIVRLCSLVLIVLCACGKNTNLIDTNTAEGDAYMAYIPDGLKSEYEWNSPEIEKLRKKYPEYFELGTFKGLEVYVWQMAEDDYRFGLMQGTNRE